MQLMASFIYIFQSFNEGPPKARTTWGEDTGQDSINNGKRVPKRRITVVGINAVEESQQEPGTKCSNSVSSSLAPMILINTAFIQISLTYIP